MASFIKKPSLSDIRKRQIYNPYGLRDVIEAFSGKSYEEVVEEQRKKREETKR